MSLTTVKNNMYQSYYVCNILENNLSKLISILNSVDGSNLYWVCNYISNIDYTINIVKRNFERMLKANKKELHILFSEFNEKSSDMIMKLNILSRDLERLSVETYELYFLYKLSQSVKAIIFFPESVNRLRRFLPNIVSVKNELQIFKMMIDANNEKLKAGARI